MTRPNVLLITTDQQRWDAVAANGNPAIATPHLDRLAAEGVRFEHSFCAATACQPSRASVLTGLFPPAHGVAATGTGRWIHPGLETLPGVLGAHGYHTVAVGKMHFEPWDALCGFAQRVLIESKYFGGEDEYRRHVRQRGLESQVVGHHVAGFGKANKALSSPLATGDHIDAFIGRRALETLQELSTRRSHQPFFLWLSFCGPHDPYDPPEPYASRFEPHDMPLPRRAENELEHLPPVVARAATAMGKEKMNLWGIPDAEIQRMRALYYGNVALIDDCIGEILEVLDQQERATDTLVIFTSDHGDCLGDHDLLWKTYLPCDADMRVPLILRWPERIAPGVRRDFASGVDLMPTILAAAGCAAPPQCQGIDLLGACAGRDHFVMYAEPNKWRYRDTKWAYTRWPDEPFDTLYDLRNDPYELDNLCYGCNEPPTATQLRSKIEDWLQHTHA